MTWIIKTQSKRKDGWTNASLLFGLWNKTIKAFRCRLVWQLKPIWRNGAWGHTPTDSLAISTSSSIIKNGRGGSFIFVSDGASLMQYVQKDHRWQHTRSRRRFRYTANKKHNTKTNKSFRKTQQLAPAWVPESGTQLGSRIRDPFWKHILFYCMQAKRVPIFGTQIGTHFWNPCLNQQLKKKPTKTKSARR